MELGDKFYKNVAMGKDDADIQSVLEQVLVEKFGATPKA
jgi:hypothetical protein